MYEIIIIIVT